MSEYARLISEKTRKARKDHHCDATEIIGIDISAGSDVDKKFTEEESTAYQNALNEKSKILKGTQYIDQTCEFDGMIYKFRARPEIWAIVQKYKIGYPD
jgi:hypothetical protein